MLSMKPRHREALILNRLHGMSYAPNRARQRSVGNRGQALVAMAVRICDKALLAAEADPAPAKSSKGAPMNISHNLSTSREDERIAREAADWLTRHIGCERAWDADGFEAWIEADPRHLETYERLARAWDDMGALGHLRPLGEPNRPFPNIVSEFAGVAAGLMRARFSAAVTALTALGLAALFVPPLTPSAARYTTAIAEIEPVLLADGSVVTLGARSGLDVDFSGRQRAVTLREGQAFFEVARNQTMPFTVHAEGLGTCSARASTCAGAWRNRRLGAGRAGRGPSRWDRAEPPHR